jgi:D-3-phosphoglycerate dehydrogenase
MAEAPRKIEVLVLNRVAQAGLQRFPAERYALVTESAAPDAVLVRSQDLHGAALGERLQAVGDVLNAGPGCGS